MMTRYFAPLSTYPDQARLASLLSSFHEEFGPSNEEGKQEEVVVVRVPGRVNLIGEHIDYCGYAVHPMAIEQDILVAVRRKGKTLRLRNKDREQYPNFELGLDKPIEIVPGEVDWWNYFLCGIKGVLEDRAVSPDTVIGMDCFVEGQIPPRAGLSSSSALVVSAAIGTLWAQSIEMEKSTLADLCASSERFIGTQGGGMDQAIEILANVGSAKLIEFNPLRTHDVRLPSGAVFVVANSLAQCNKAEGADYNARVAECRMATKVLAKAIGVEGGEARNLLRLGDLQEKSGFTLAQMLEKVPQILHEEPYDREEVCSLLEMSDEELVSSCLIGNTFHLRSGFALRRRARHVYSEALRVYEFRDACLKEGAGTEEALHTLGRLMFESHRSCAEDYQCSHPQLDRLVELSKQHGALGARLTGAGWGGCIVALVPSDKLATFLSGIKRDYFSSLPAAEGKELDSLVFATKPGGGATILRKEEE